MIRVVSSFCVFVPVETETEAKEDSYQCLWVVKMEGLASCWTWIMKVFFSAFEEEEAAAHAIVMEKSRRREREKEDIEAIEV